VYPKNIKYQQESFLKNFNEAIEGLELNDIKYKSLYIVKFISQHKSKRKSYRDIKF
jgi:hypothetical protein